MPLLFDGIKLWFCPPQHTNVLAKAQNIAAGQIYFRRECQINWSNCEKDFVVKTPIKELN